MIKRSLLRPRSRSSHARPGQAIAVGLGVALWALPAAAHIELTLPSARYTPDHQKNEPCGHADNPPGEDPPHVYQPGETITVMWDEFINHNGHFRIAFDPTGTDNFTSPTGFDDFYNSPEVLLDDIADDQNGGIHMVEVTLPDEPCNPCTLQLIQVMNDGTWGPGTSDLYFQCADIVLENVAADSGSEGGDSTDGGATSDGETSGGSTNGGEGPGEDTSSPSGGSDGSGEGSDGGDGAEEGEGGCSCRSSGGSSGSAAWLLLGLIALRRRSDR